MNIFFFKDYNGKLWVEVIIVTFLNAVTTVDVSAASNNDLKLGETRTVQVVWLLIVVSF